MDCLPDFRPHFSGWRPFQALSRDNAAPASFVFNRTMIGEFSGVDFICRPPDDRRVKDFAAPARFGRIE
jgi:hypothetical protein